MLSKKCILVLVPLSFLGCQDPADTCGNGQIEDDREPCYDLATSVAAGVSVVSVAAGDFGGDGSADLAAASNQTDDVGVLLGDIDFFASFFFSVGNSPNAVVAADFNNDGRPDLATANVSSNDVSILLSNP